MTTKSIDQKLTARVCKLAWLDQLFVRDFDHVELAFQLRFPKMQEFMQNGKARREVEFLPDVGLQQSGVVGQAVNNLRRRQAVIFKLFREVAAGFM